VSEKIELKYTKMAENIELDKELVEKLKHSDFRLRWSFPIVKSRRTGRIIDGKHREAADPKWPVVYIDTEDDAEEFAARLELNLKRRTMSEEEKRILVGAIAEQLLLKGVKRENLVDEITKRIKLGEKEVSRRWVYKYLPDEFKREYHMLKTTKSAQRAKFVKPEEEEEGEVKETKPVVFPFRVRGRVSRMDEAPADGRFVWVEGLEKPVLVSSLTGRYMPWGELKVGDEVEVVVEGDKGRYYDHSYFGRVREEAPVEEQGVEEEKEEKGETKEEEEVKYLRRPSPDEVFEVVYGVLSERWDEYIQHEKVPGGHIISVICSGGVLTIGMRYPARVRAEAREEEEEERKEEKRRFDIKAFMREMNESGIAVKVTTEGGVVKVTTSSYLNPDQFSKYVEICKKYGLRYDPKDKTWTTGR